MMERQEEQTAFTVTVRETERDNNVISGDILAAIEATEESLSPVLEEVAETGTRTEKEVRTATARPCAEGPFINDICIVCGGHRAPRPYIKEEPLTEKLLPIAYPDVCRPDSSGTCTLCGKESNIQYGE